MTRMTGPLSGRDACGSQRCPTYHWRANVPANPTRGRAGLLLPYLRRGCDARCRNRPRCGFIQHSLSRSVRGVVRGLHIRRGNGEAKLVRCSFGAIFDVILDLRPTSPTYLNWESFELRDDEQITLYVPAGCAHGFQALTDAADVSYMIDCAHDPSEDVSIAFDDPGLAISWPLPVTVMSSRDRLAPSLADATGLLA